MDHIFLRTERMRDAFHRIILTVGPVVHRVYAPLVTGAVVGCVHDAVHDRVAHDDIGMGHIDLGAQDAAAFRKLAILHSFQQVEIFYDRTVPVG